MIRACVIGVSGYGDVHYKDLLRWHRAGTLCFSAATVINPAEEQEKCEVMRELGVRIYQDYREMLDAESGSDKLCCIPTGIHQHAPMAMDAMRAGCNVLMEKPAAATIQDIESIQRTEQETGRFAAVGFQDIYRPEYQTLKRRILDGMIGKIESVTVYAAAPAGKKYYGRNHWAGKLRVKGHWILDSPFNNSNAHQINLALFLCGGALEKTVSPETVSAELYRACPVIESADTGSILLEADGISFHIVMSRGVSDAPCSRITIHGSRGNITLTPEELLVDGDSFPVCREYSVVRDQVLGSVLRRFDDSNVLTATLEIAKAHTLCINGAHESSPVTEIPVKCLECCSLYDDEIYVIPKIQEIMECCIREKKMFSMVAPELFHGRGRQVNLRDYHCFQIL